MIRAKDKSWLYIAIPKTGTRSLSKILLRKGEQIGVQHTMPQDRQRLADVHFAIFRDPFERMTSLWHMHLRTDNQLVRDLMDEQNLRLSYFVDFVEFCKNNHDHKDLWFLKPQSEYVKHCDRVIPFTDIHRVSAIVGPTDIPHLNKTSQFINLAESFDGLT